jgi:hypothetical protein
MKKLADAFRIQLTSSAMQELRSSAIASDTALKAVILSCGIIGPDGSVTALSDQDRSNLLDLYAGLGVLGRPQDWQNPDGTTKTLADFLPGSASILETLEKLGGQADGTLKQKYEQEYKKAGEDAAHAQSQLDLAKAQLAHLLG